MRQFFHSGCSHGGKPVSMNSMDKVVPGSMIRVLFVCLGNICRSPIAEGLCRHEARRRGLDLGDSGRILIDSAGTGGWHLGAPPDARAVAVAGRHGVDIRDLKARKVAPEDFDDFHFILAMDRDNLRDLEEICPADRQDRLHLLMSFAPRSGIKEIPDPYHTMDETGFERIFFTIQDGVTAFLDHLEQSGALATTRFS